MLQILTPTGGRPLAWAFCQRWMAAQTYAGPVKWIVVDDVEPAQSVTFQREGWAVMTVQPRPAWQGRNTHGRNLLEGLALCDPRHPVVLVEDDDYYRPSWLATVAAALESADLVGETHATYYHVGTRRWLRYRNTTHASLCATAMAGRVIRQFREVIALRSALFEDSVRQLFDATLWHEHPGGHLFDGQSVIGMKGIPGRRGGIGVGHHDHFGRNVDRDGAMLRTWLGADAEAYLPLYGAQAA